jgi:hypothetical protein
MLTPKAWTTSSWSHANGNCVEVGWHTASESGNCVEAGPCACGQVQVRDTKDRDGGQLQFTPAAWMSLLTGIKHGEFTI